MRQHEITTTHTRPKSRRIGRGNGSGRGTFAGRGVKGQKARSGFNIPRTFIGGSTALVQRLPKLKGFKSGTTKPVTLNITRIAAVFAADEPVTLKSLLEKGLVSAKEAERGVKVVGSSAKLTYKLKLEPNAKLTASKKLLA